MRQFIYLVFVTFFCSSAFSQTINWGAMGGGSNTVTVAKKVLDEAEYTVTYEYTYVKDAAKPNERRNGSTILQIGKNYNRFWDYYRFKFDSINDALAEKKANDILSMNQMVAARKNCRFEDAIIIDKQKNIIVTQTTKVPFSKYQYTEAAPELNWDLIEGDTIMGNYHCQKAKTRLFGREYIAWYCPDVDLPYGPYKFNGLPGLIFRVTEVNGNFDFNICAIEKSANKSPIYLWKRYSESSREAVRTMYKNSCANPVQFLPNDGSVIISDEVKASVKSRPYNPIELE